jgi:hypothetical protein
LGQITPAISSNKSRLPISILPDNPEEKRKYVIKLVLEQFPCLSFKSRYHLNDGYDLNSSALCPICNFYHKEKTSKNSITGEWGSGGYYEENTYRLQCGNAFYKGIQIVTVKV